MSTRDGTDGVLPTPFPPPHNRSRRTPSVPCRSRTLLCESMLTCAILMAHTNTNTKVTEAPFHADNGCKRDSTPAVQAALDLCSHLGCGTVYAPKGCYRFDGSLLLPDGVSLQGTPRSEQAQPNHCISLILFPPFPFFSFVGLG